MEAHYDRVYALCRRMLGNDADALDATQDCLVAAVRGLGRFDGRAAFGTWLYRIATNSCLDELRRRRRRPVLGLDGVAGGTSGYGAPGRRLFGERGAGTGLSDEKDPADVVASRAAVDDALGALAPEFRTAVVLRDVCDLSYEEIAEILGVPIGTVRSRIARGRSAVARRWGAAGNPDGPAGVRAHGAQATDPKELSP